MKPRLFRRMFQERGNPSAGHRLRRRAGRPRSVRLQTGSVALLAALGACHMAFGQGYSTWITAPPNTTSTERRCYKDGFHFLTFVDDGNGTFAIRPHPGTDPNGWGSTLYLQPFLPNAVLRYTVYTSFAAYPDHIQVAAEGQVSRAADAAYGTWSAGLEFTFDASLRRVAGTGSYSISLSGNLPVGEDLNLYKLASNYLINVPLRSYLCGITGDMAEVQYAGDVLAAGTWSPATDCLQSPSSCGHFPSEENHSLRTTALGRLNTVDSAAQGLGFCISPAYKPTISVELATPMQVIQFGVLYTFGESRSFDADNIGITPWVSHKSSLTDFNFAVDFWSNALGEDGMDSDFDGIPDAQDPEPQCVPCRGSLTTNLTVDGQDIADFIRCLSAGTPAAIGCTCADMDANNTMDDSDLAAFVDRLLGRAIPCP